MSVQAWITALILFFGSLGVREQPDRFTGTWEAATQGKVILVLKIRAGERISGTMDVGAIQLSDEGELLDADPVADHEAPFFFAKTEGDKLEFDYQDQGDNAIMHFEMRLTAEGTGELRIVDEHLPKMTPFRLRKRQA